MLHTIYVDVYKILQNRPSSSRLQKVMIVCSDLAGVEDVQTVTFSNAPCAVLEVSKVSELSTWLGSLQGRRFFISSLSGLGSLEN